MFARRFLLLAALTLLAVPAWAGYHYKAVTTTTGTGMGQASESTMEVEGWVDGGMTKVVFTDASAEDASPFFGEGKYLVVTDPESAVVYLVDTTAKTYSEFDLSQIVGALGELADTGVMNMEVSDHQVEKISEQDGGRLHGYSTTHYTYRTSYTMSIGVLGMKRSDDYVIESEMWTTQDLDSSGFDVWLQKLPKKTGFEPVDQLMEGEFSKMTGFPLKSVQRTRTQGTNKKRRTMDMVSTTEVTLLEEQPISRAMFSIDPTYTRVDLMPDLGELGAMRDGDEEAAADEEEEEDEKGGMLKRLRKLRKKDGGR